MKQDMIPIIWFSDPYRSIALTDYYYKIPEKYMGKKLHFVLSDWATDSFGGITADSFRTSYEKQPDLTGMYKAGNSVSENESEEWIIREGGNGTQRAYLSPPVINGNIDDAVRLDTTFLAGYINQIV